MLLEHIAIQIQEQIDALARRVASLEMDSHTPVDWKQLIDNMEERLRRLEAEVDSIS
tara:strand:- start:3388 stop:3558 length:171 start_codon:yes stop_codon:yes gene_type:complete